MSVAEIEAAITRLAAGEVAELTTWLETHQERLWDQQIGDDLQAGRLDSILAEVDKKYDAGTGQP